MQHNDVLKQKATAPRALNRVTELSPRLVRHIARYANEASNGARNIHLLGARITNRVAAYLQLTAQEKRMSLGAKLTRTPVALPGNISFYRFNDTIIDTVVMMHETKRSFPISMRFEFFDDRWRATEIVVL